MRKRCKYLIDSTKGWPKELVSGCLQLELFVESLDGVEITNSISDFQPSYVVYKIEGDKQFEMLIDPRIRNGKIVYFVQDNLNKIQTLLNSVRRGPVYLDPNEPGARKNPHKWDFDTLKEKIKNIDMNDGYLLKRVS